MMARCGHSGASIVNIVCSLNLSSLCVQSIAEAEECFNHSVLKGALMQSVDFQMSHTHEELAERFERLRVG
jgi:hypothetical protein